MGLPVGMIVLIAAERRLLWFDGQRWLGWPDDPNGWWVTYPSAEALVLAYGFPIEA